MFSWSSRNFNFSSLTTLNANRFNICPLQSACSLESNLEGLAGVLEADLPNYKSKILRLLCTVYVCKRFVDPGDDVLSTLPCFWGMCR